MPPIEFVALDKPKTIHHKVQLSKGAERELGAKVTRKHMDEIVNVVNTVQREKNGWQVSLDIDDTVAYLPTFMKREYNSEPGGSLYMYYVTFSVNCSPDKERNTLDTEFAAIVDHIERKAKFPGKWDLAKVDGEDWKKKKEEEVADKKERDAQEIGYLPLEIPDDFEVYFDHLYGLEAHISRVKRAIEGTMETGWKKRLHCALIGPPGCGKSDISHSIKEAVGAENVLEFDATSTTMAGAQKQLAEMAENGSGLPRILLVEEIEKADDKSLAWLLSLMDLRGEIRKTTARGKINTDTKMICIATVNDVPTFKKIAFGALYSRFSNKIYFRRPTRELLGRILEREVSLINGNREWIIPTLDMADKIQTTDPREVISLMLCGRDALLTGEFQNEWEATSDYDEEGVV